jgi:hypothetical protein
MYTIADERLSFKVPESINPAEASSVPLAANTAWLALFSEDCLALSSDKTGEKVPLLIWGGNSTYLDQSSTGIVLIVDSHRWLFRHSDRQASQHRSRHYLQP